MVNSLGYKGSFLHIEQFEFFFFFCIFFPLLINNHRSNSILNRKMDNRVFLVQQTRSDESIKLFFVIFLLHNSIYWVKNCSDICFLVKEDCWRYATQIRWKHDENWRIDMASGNLLIQICAEIFQNIFSIGNIWLDSCHLRVLSWESQVKNELNAFE